jgi:hypothetical protein
MPTNAAGTRRSTRAGRSNSGYAGFETETLAYLGAIDGNTQFATAINDFVRGCKSDGVWDLVDWIWPLAGNNLKTALVPLKARGSYLAPCTNFNFVNSDYSERVGLTSNGTTKWLQAAATWDSYPTGNCHFSAYVCSVPDTPINSVMLGGGSTQRRIEPSYSVLTGGIGVLGVVMGGNFCSINPTPDQFTTGYLNCTDYIGLLSGIEAGPTGYACFRGQLGTTVAITPGTVVTGRVGICAQAPATGTTPITWSSTPVGFACLGPAINVAQLSLLNARVETLMLAMGRRRYPTIKTAVDGILTLGQSLQQGVSGSQTRNSSQTYGNLMVAPSANGIINVSAVNTTVNLTNYSQLSSLVEAGQSSSSAMANSLRSAGWSNPILVSGTPLGSAAYSTMAQGANGYNNSLNKHRVARYYVNTLAGQTYAVKCMVCTHGEADDIIQNGSYDANLLTWQSNYEADVKAITGQAAAIPMFFTQMNSWSGYKPRETPVVAPLQYSAWSNNPTKLFLVGPKYMFTYNSSDKVHLADGNQYCWLGEYYAKAIYKYFVNGSWAPLAPLSVTRTGASIVIVFNKGGLTLDTTLVTDPSGTYASRTYTQPATSATNTTVTNFKGFEFVDDNATSPSANVTAASISTTTITNDTVTLTLSATPTSTNKRIRYAYSMTSGNAAGPITGARGNLRDSDTSYSSLYGNTLYNWCPTFDLSAA